MKRIVIYLLAGLSDAPNLLLLLRLLDRFLGIDYSI